MGEVEVVGVLGPGRECVLGDAGDAVVVIAQGQAVPVHAGGVAELVGNSDVELVAHGAAQGWRHERAVIAGGGDGLTG